MKRLMFFAIAAITLQSCDAPKENKVEERQSLMRIDTFPNGAIAYNDMDWELKLVDTTGKHAYLGFNAKGQGVWLTKDSTWKKEVRIPRSTFWITMSEKMVKRFMTITNYFTKDLLLSIVLLIIGIVLVRLFIKGDWMRFMGKGGALGFILVAYIGVTIRIAQKRPTELAGNNVKQLSRAEYEYWKAKDSTFTEFWLHKWEKNELSGLTNKKAK